MDWIIRGLGVFYLLGGVVALRQVWINRYLDRALAQITLQPTPTVEHVFNGSGATIGLLTALSGLALILLHPWAVWAFGACWVAQALYLLWASRWYPPEDAIAATGRRQTINAFGLYSLATGWVIWLADAAVLG